MANPKPMTQHPTGAPDVTPTPEDAADTSSTPSSQAEPSTTSEVLDLRKKELIDQVVERTGVKKRDAKPVIEAMPAVWGEASSAERAANLEPRGKLRVTRSKDTPNGRQHAGRVRRKKAGSEKPTEETKAAPAPLAERDS